MCGLTGFMTDMADRSRNETSAIVRRMADTLSHRGPDDAGVWLSDDGTVALGHRRLAILDLSPLGHQPMVSRCGRFVLAYNGEIYNHRVLRQELAALGHEFRGQSDTETLLAAVVEWGLADTLPKTIGMFALALWDRDSKTLTLARDRMGIKPLYYGRCGGAVLFGSELKTLRAHPGFTGTIERRSVALLMQHCHIPAPHSIYSHVHKLPPGSMLTIRQDLTGSLPQPAVWWDARSVARTSIQHPFPGTYDEARDELHRRLRSAVADRLIADVPLGAFLSGGIDSSLVVALMQTVSSRPVNTFTMGFEEASCDEAVHARAVAQHLGTRHTEFMVTAQDARDVIPTLPQMFDEPFADSSQIPTFLVSKLARQHVTVCLSGDGGDELFGGYHRYFHIAQRWQALTRIPLRPVLAGLLAALAMAAPGRWRQRFEYRSHLCRTRDASELYQHANLHWPHGGRNPVLFDAEANDTAATTYWNRDRWLSTGDPVSDWMWLDTVSYLPDDILTKVDRASMAVGLEARVPLLDQRVFEFAWSLPLDWKVDGGTGKRILKDVLAGYVPREMFERPKMGFGVPLGEWLRGPLRDWAEALLNERRLQSEGWFDPRPVRQRWQQHLSGKVDWHYHLWDVLMFQSWLEHNQQ